MFGQAYHTHGVLASERPKYGSLELVRFPDQMPAAFAADVVSNLRRILRGPEDPAAMTTALAPLVAQIDEDLSVATRVVKQAMG